MLRKVAEIAGPSALWYLGIQQGEIRLDGSGMVFEILLDLDTPRTQDNGNQWQKRKNPIE